MENTTLKPRKRTKLTKIIEKLNELKPGESFNVNDFVEKHWDEANSLTVRTFDVYYCNAKKQVENGTFYFKRKLGRIYKLSRDGKGN